MMQAPVGGGFRNKFRKKRKTKKLKRKNDEHQYEEVELSGLGQDDANGSYDDDLEGLRNVPKSFRDVEEQAVANCRSLLLKQKIRLLSGLNMWQIKPVPAFDIPPLWLCDGPHGLRKQNKPNPTNLIKGRIPSTCFPTASALACSWDPLLLQRVGVALGRECRQHGVSVLLGPGMNIIRHPCGGRNFEYFSEDPFLTGQLAAANIRGIQSQGIAACPKHFCANNQETDRWTLDVIVDERALREIYWKAWEIAVREAQPWCLMAAYNKVNGLYNTENRVLMQRVLRGEWGYEGLVMTDWGATNNRAKGIAAGVDLEMPGSCGSHDYNVLESFYGDELKETQIADCAVRVMSLMLIAKHILDNGNPLIDEVQHHELAHKAAVNSCVLLKNDKDLLPLKHGTSVAIIGEFAERPRIQGMGSSQVLPTSITTAGDRFQDFTPNIEYAPGYSTEKSNDEGLAHALIEEAVECAKSCDVAVVFVGLPEGYEAEGFDRASMELPETHDVLVEQVSEANPNTVVVLMNGAPVAIPWVDDVPAILEAWLGGQASGTAVADLIFGQETPSGKLAQTFPVDLADVPAAKHFPGRNQQVQYREGLNVGYRYFDSADKPVLFPFGHGLTYTTFEFSALKIDFLVDSLEDTQMDVSVTVTNSGTRHGHEVVQLYIKDCERSIYRPIHELKAFQKIYLAPQESTTVKLHLGQEAFTFWDVGVRKWIVEPGRFEIQVGSSSRDIRLTETVAVAKGFHATRDARSAHLPAYYPIQDIADDDEGFSNALGYPVPRPETSNGYFTYNTPLRDIRTSWLGAKVYDRVMQRVFSNLANRDDPLEYAMQREFAESMPLRGLVMFSNGLLNFDLLELLLSVMNGEYAYMRALCMAPAVLISWAIMRWCGVNNRV